MSLGGELYILEHGRPPPLTTSALLSAAVLRAPSFCLWNSGEHIHIRPWHMYPLCFKTQFIHMIFEACCLTRDTYFLQESLQKIPLLWKKKSKKFAEVVVARLWIRHQSLSSLTFSTFAGKEWKLLWMTKWQRDSLQRSWSLGTCWAEPITISNI